MTQDLLSILGFWFSYSFQLWNSFKIPGTNFSPAGWMIFGASAYIGINFIIGLFSGGKDD